eukprot:CAMPEP_0204352832 /NCGR_PEP_ID=MMETSP0469-20131031/32194_1 /ASSEMBLY_ACC=CAM_ASM_000384 /TAXON_ID=2969 /ORGANISM="Oxyrrhis marina" /LENGTH=83 /DNA_ID=CAMNT_0051339641 /DNA_START=66 /DNA_END=314 /DNA_ORIENTATION=-
MAVAPRQYGAAAEEESSEMASQSEDELLQGEEPTWWDDNPNLTDAELRERGKWMLAFIGWLAFAGILLLFASTWTGASISDLR